MIRSSALMLAVAALLTAGPAGAQRNEDVRTARALSKILGVKVSPAEVEVRPAERLSTRWTLPGPLQSIAGERGRRFLAVRLDEVSLGPNLQVAFSVPDRWKHRLAAADAVLVTSEQGYSKACWVAYCEGSSCKFSQTWVMEGVICPPSFCSNDEICKAGTQQCWTRACDPSGICGPLPIQAPAGEPCPQEELCSDNSDCETTKQCPANECSCFFGDCDCIEMETTVTGPQPCPEPDCRSKEDCKEGDGGLLDGLLETETSSG